MMTSLTSSCSFSALPACARCHKKIIVCSAGAKKTKASKEHEGIKFVAFHDEGEKKCYKRMERIENGMKYRRDFLLHKS